MQGGMRVNRWGEVNGDVGTSIEGIRGSEVIIQEDGESDQMVMSYYFISLRTFIILCLFVVYAGTVSPYVTLHPLCDLVEDLLATLSPPV